MIDAKLLATFFGGGEYLRVFGVWIPRKGDNVRLTMEVIANHFTNLSAEVFQKNYDEVGDGTGASVSLSFNEATGRQTAELLGVKELVRFQLKLAPGDNLPDSDVGIVLFRFLQPVWFETVNV